MSVCSVSGSHQPPGILELILIRRDKEEGLSQFTPQECLYSCLLLWEFPIVSTCFSFTRSLIPSSPRWQVKGGGNRRCTPGLLLYRERETDNERQTKAREREVVLELVLCISGLFIPNLLHKCVCMCTTVSLLVCASLHLLMCPLSCMHTQYMHNVLFWWGTFFQSALLQYEHMQFHNNLSRSLILELYSCTVDIEVLLDCINLLSLFIPMHYSSDIGMLLLLCTVKGVVVMLNTLQSQPTGEQCWAQVH